MYLDVGTYSTRVKISSEGGRAMIGNYNTKIKGVVLYEDDKYKGDYQYINKDISDLNVGNIDFNDATSSIRLNNIKKVFFYTNNKYGGTSITIKADTKSLSPFGWNDQVSSLKIIK